MLLPLLNRVKTIPDVSALIQSGHQDYNLMIITLQTWQCGNCFFFYISPIRSSLCWLTTAKIFQLKSQMKNMIYMQKIDYTGLFPSSQSCLSKMFSEVRALFTLYKYSRFRPCCVSDMSNSSLLRCMLNECFSFLLQYMTMR